MSGAGGCVVTRDGVGRNWFTEKVRESVGLLERDFSTKTWGKVQTLEERHKNTETNEEGEQPGQEE
jgi:hypothetical protein